METDEVMTRYRNPRYQGGIDSLGTDTEECRIVSASGENMLCGDTLSVVLRIRKLFEGGYVVEEGRYEGYGCSLCIASAEAVMEAVRGRSVEECKALSDDDVIAALGSVEVSRSRRKCVRLPLEAMRAALSS